MITSCIYTSFCFPLPVASGGLRLAWRMRVLAMGVATVPSFVLCGMSLHTCRRLWSSYHIEIGWRTESFPSIPKQPTHKTMSGRWSPVGMSAKYCLSISALDLEWSPVGPRGASGSDFSVRLSRSYLLSPGTVSSICITSSGLLEA